MKSSASKFSNTDGARYYVPDSKWIVSTTLARKASIIGTSAIVSFSLSPQPPASSLYGEQDSAFSSSSSSCNHPGFHRRRP